MQSPNHLALMVTTTLKQANSSERSSEAKGLGIIDGNAIDKEVSTVKKERIAYQKWTPFDRFKIGKYASENGNISSYNPTQ